MKSMIKKGISYILCVAVIFLSIPAEVVYAKNTTQTAAKVKIESIEGKAVVVNAAGKEIDARADMNLYSGYQVKTESKSYVYISLDESKAIKLDALSEVEIRKSGKKLELYVITGNLFFNVEEKLTAEETLSVKTSNMSMGIRGTSGMVGHSIEQNGEENMIQIYDGVVEITMPTQKLDRNYYEEDKEEIEIVNYLNGASVIKLTAGNQMQFILPVEQGKTGKVNMNRLSEDNIRGFVAQAIKNDTLLQERIKEDTPLQVDKIIENAEKKLKEEEQTTEKKENSLINQTVQTIPSSIIITNNTSESSTKSSSETSSHLQNLIVNCQKGNKIGTVQVSASPITGGKLYYSITTENIENTVKENQVFTEISEFISGSNINVSIGSYINLYELDAKNRLKAFTKVLVSDSILKRTISSFTFEEDLFYQEGDSVRLIFAEPNAEEIKTIEVYLVKENTNITTPSEIKNMGKKAEILNETIQIPSHLEKGRYQIYLIDADTNTFLGSMQFLNIIEISDITPSLEINTKKGNILGSFCLEPTHTTGNLYYNIADNIPISFPEGTILNTKLAVLYQIGDEISGGDSVGRYIIIYECDTEGKLLNYTGKKITMEMLKCPESFSIDSSKQYKEGETIIEFQNIPNSSRFYLSQDGNLNTYSQIIDTYPFSMELNIGQGEMFNNAYLYIDSSIMPVNLEAGEYYIYYADTKSKTFTRSNNTFNYVLAYVENAGVTGEKGTKIGTTKVSAFPLAGGTLYYSITAENIENHLYTNQVIEGLEEFVSGSNIHVDLNSYINIYELDTENKLKSFGKVFVTEDIWKTKITGFSFNDTLTYTKNSPIILEFEQPDAEEIASLEAYLVLAGEDINITSLEEIRSNGVLVTITDNKLYISEAIETGNYSIYLIDPNTNTFVGNNQILSVILEGITPSLEIVYTKGSTLETFCAEATAATGNLYYEISDSIPSAFPSDKILDTSTMTAYSSREEIAEVELIGKYIIIYEYEADGTLINYNGKEITMEMLKRPENFSLDNSKTYKNGDKVENFESINGTEEFYLSQDGELNTYSEIIDSYKLLCTVLGPPPSASDLETDISVFKTFSIDVCIPPDTAGLEEGNYYIYRVDQISKTFTRSDNTISYVLAYVENTNVMGEKSTKIGTVKVSASSVTGGRKSTVKQML